MKVTKLLEFCAAPLKIETSVTGNQQASQKEGNTIWG
jgi:hypothetical protein